MTVSYQQQRGCSISNVPPQKKITNINVPKVINVHRDRFSVILIESMILCHEGGMLKLFCEAVEPQSLGFCTSGYCRFVFDQCSLRNKTTLAQQSPSSQRPFPLSSLDFLSTTAPKRPASSQNQVEPCCPSSVSQWVGKRLDRNPPDLLAPINQSLFLSGPIPRSDMKACYSTRQSRKQHSEDPGTGLSPHTGALALLF